jgi:hypothetical protein
MHSRYTTEIPAGFFSSVGCWIIIYETGGHPKNFIHAYIILNSQPQMNVRRNASLCKKTEKEM